MPHNDYKFIAELPFLPIVIRIFPACAVLAAAGVLLSLLDPTWRGAGMLRAIELMLLPGVVVFVLIGALGMAVNGRFLEYPTDIAGTLILCVEGFAALSIAATLQTLFAGTTRVGGML